MPVFLTVIIAVALVPDFLNGFHDSSNVVATMIPSRVMSPRNALAMTALADLVGSFLFGLAVARDTALAWLLTIPVSAAMATGLYLLVSFPG